MARDSSKTESNASSIANRLRAIREHLRVRTNEDLAKYLGVHSMTIEGWERNKRPLSISAQRALETVKRLCAVSQHVLRSNRKRKSKRPKKTTDYWGLLGLATDILDQRITLSVDEVVEPQLLEDFRMFWSQYLTTFALFKISNECNLNEEEQFVLVGLLLHHLAVPRSEKVRVRTVSPIDTGYALLLGAVGNQRLIGSAMEILDDGAALIRCGLITCNNDKVNRLYSTYSLTSEAYAKLTVGLPNSAVPKFNTQNIGGNDGDDDYEQFEDSTEHSVPTPFKPRIRMVDVVLRDEVRMQLDRIVALLKHKSLVLDEWKMRACFHHGSGVAVLLHGKPGLGKTMCAEALASELGKNIISATTSQIVDKWLGSTDRNIARLFQLASIQDAVVFLDEADGLLCTREYARHSHEVRHVNCMLREIEQHNGLTILASNLKPVLDTALERRLIGNIEFLRPGPVEREQLWRIHLSGAIPIQGKIDLKCLATYDLTGAEIRNAVVTAVADALRQDGPEATISQESLELAAEALSPVVQTIGFARTNGSHAASAS